MQLTQAIISSSKQLMDLLFAFIKSTQLEILIFVLAFCMHVLVFGKHRVGHPKSAAAKKMTKQAVPPDCTSCGSKPGLESRNSSTPPKGSGEEAEVSKTPKATLAVLKAALQEGNLEAILRCLPQLPKTLPSSSVQQGLLQKMARLAAVKGQVDAVLREACCCNLAQTWFYNMFLDACIEAGEMEAASRVMSEATKLGKVDVVTYNTMVKAHLRSGDLQVASSTIEAMRSAGMQPNNVTFNELLDVAVKADVKGAWRLVDEMKACGLQPNKITGSILLKTVQLGSCSTDVDRALAVLEGLTDMDEVLLSSALEACVRVARRDLVSRLIDRHWFKKSVRALNAQTYGSIIRALGFLNNAKAAQEAWDSMCANNILPTSITLGCTVEAFVTNKEPDTAHALLRTVMADPKIRGAVNAVIYCSVLKGFAHQKRFDRVWALYEEMIAENLQSQFTSVTFNTLIDACSRCGEVSRAPGLLEEMVRCGIKPNIVTYSAVLKGLCQVNQLGKAFELVETMKTSHHIKIDEQTYNTLLDGCARQGLYSRGMEVFADMKNMGVQPSNFTLSILVKLANRGKQLEVAFSLAEELSTKHKFKLNVHVYNNLVQACFAHKRPERAMAVLDRMLSEGCQTDQRTHSLLLRGFLGTGDAQSVVGLVRSTMGLPGGLSRLADIKKEALQPPEGVSVELLSEAVRGIARDCRAEGLAAELAGELRRLGVRLDARLSLQLVARTAGMGPRAAT